MRRSIFFNSRALRYLGVAAPAMAALTGRAAAQCAMCNTAAASGNVGRGLSVSVLFMLGMLFTIVASFVVLVVRSGAREATGYRDGRGGSDAGPENAPDGGPAPGMAAGLRRR